ncbi:MAG: hypothetical protein QM698_01035 [Micropepsaceae bacterium]
MTARFLTSAGFGALLLAASVATAQTPAPATDPTSPPPTLPGDPAEPVAGAAPVAATAPTAAEVDARLDTLFGSHAPYKAFLTDLQKATAAEDKKAVAAMISYPITVKIGGADKTFENEKDFIAGYDDVFTPATLLAIKNQTYETLFANDQGIMIGGTGEVWASEIMTDDAEPKSEGVKIIAINHL